MGSYLIQIKVNITGTQTSSYPRSGLGYLEASGHLEFTYQTPIGQLFSDVVDHCKLTKKQARQINVLFILCIFSENSNCLSYQLIYFRRVSDDIENTVQCVLNEN